MHRSDRDIVQDWQGYLYRVRSEWQILARSSGDFCPVPWPRGKTSTPIYYGTNNPPTAILDVFLLFCCHPVYIRGVLHAFIVGHIHAVAPESAWCRISGYSSLSVAFSSFWLSPTQYRLRTLNSNRVWDRTRKGPHPPYHPRMGILAKSLDSA